MEDDGLWSAVGKATGCFAILLSIPLLYILNGWALSVLWGWFIVPLGAPYLSIPLAIGVSTTVGLFFSNVATQKIGQNKGEGSGAYLLRVLYISTMKPLFTLGIGWIVHFFVRG